MLDKIISWNGCADGATRRLPECHWFSLNRDSQQPLKPSAYAAGLCCLSKQQRQCFCGRTHPWSYGRSRTHGERCGRNWNPKLS